MSPHDSIDDDHENPPPSGQGASGVPVEVRSERIAAPRPVARQHVARAVNQTLVASRAASTSTSSHASAPSPVADRSSCLSTSNTHDGHIPTSSNLHCSASSTARAGNSARPPPPSSHSAVAPAIRTFFDPWNSSSTGHQRAENRLSGSTSWRVSRNLKLREQYRSGANGGKRVADTVGAGSEDFGKDGRKENGGWEKGAKGLRTGGQKSLVEVWGQSKASAVAKKSSQEAQFESCTELEHPGSLRDEVDATSIMEEEPIAGTDEESFEKLVEKQIFDGLCFYINGSTAPLISDHKLKHMLAAHGADYSIALGRRTVTHVILGTTCGGGLAASKIEKEVSRSRGKALKFVTAEWVLESIKANRRLPESSFSPLKLAPKNQAGLVGTILSTKPPATAG